MLGISKIVSIEEYNATNKRYCDKCELYEWNHTISFKNGDKYLPCNGCAMEQDIKSGIQVVILRHLEPRGPTLKHVKEDKF